MEMLLSDGSDAVSLSEASVNGGASGSDPTRFKFEKRLLKKVEF